MTLIKLTQHHDKTAYFPVEGIAILEDNYQDSDSAMVIYNGRSFGVLESVEEILQIMRNHGRILTVMGGVK